MSSDEEQDIGGRKQYEVILPAWRSERVTAWLRIFDALYVRAKRSGLLSVYPGPEARLRVVSDRRSTSGKFVAKLPRDAYDDEWLRGQDEAIVQPGPRARYSHDGATIG
jgi:hypothetical protein